MYKLKQKSKPLLSRFRQKYLHGMCEVLRKADTSVRGYDLDKAIGLITNEEVIKELLKTAEEIANLKKQGDKLGLSEEELAFYDALTKPENIKDFYENEVLVAMTRELTEMLRKNRTIDWQKKETARAKMRSMVKRLLKKYKYPPEKYETAIETVISQCEMWTDNAE